MKKYTTDIKNNIYFKEEKVSYNKLKKYIESNVVIVYKNEVINKWQGMGGAITEATGYNYSLLDNDKKQSLINDLFSSDGLNYNIIRLPIGSNDFALSSYQYAKKKDLSDFSVEEDKKYIIPMLNDVYFNKNITLISSPWSPPSFMKNNKILILGGKLKDKYYDLYANYLVKYIDSYNELGYKINYLTMQNEPMAIQIWESCTFSIDEQKEFINNHLSNKLKDKDTNIILWDHNRENIYNIVNDLYSDNIKGIGLHWYSGRFYNNMKLIHKKYPDLLIINTEMCCGFSNYNENEWIRDAEEYLKDIINSMNSGLSAYLDWNLLLNYQGGPHHVKNPVKASIILNEENNDYIKTPIYYYLKHISHFISEGYEIIESDRYEEQLFVVSAKKDNNLVVVILNPSDYDFNYNILIDNNYIKDKIKSHSIITYME